jgi:Sulfatase
VAAQQFWAVTIYDLETAGFIRESSRAGVDPYDQKHRPDRKRRHEIHRLLRRKQLHGRPFDLHHRPELQSCLRTGLSKVGIPGAPVGLQKGDITIAQALKPLGYATGQFGKNHLGDKDEFLPTNHGFDEFYGNLYQSGCTIESAQRIVGHTSQATTRIYDRSGGRLTLQEIERVQIGKINIVEFRA